MNKPTIRQEQISEQENAQLTLLYNEAEVLKEIANRKLAQLEQSDSTNMLWQTMHKTYTKLLENARDASTALRYARDCYKGQTPKDTTIFVPSDSELCTTGFLDHKKQALQYLEEARKIATELSIPVAEYQQPAAEAPAPALIKSHDTIFSLLSNARKAIIEHKQSFITGAKVGAGVMATYSFCKGINYCSNHPTLLLVLTALLYAKYNKTFSPTA